MGWASLKMHMSGRIEEGRVERRVGIGVGGSGYLV